MIEIDELLNKLNEEQIKPVTDTEGAVLVIAGAGSGKTRVLTTRIAYLIQKKRVNPKNIMAITFTNKAAKEMQERLDKIVGETVDMWVSTIHSMCVKILRRDIDKLGYDKNFTIYDDVDKDKVLKRVFENLGYDTDKLLKTAKNYISKAKNDCLTPSEFGEKHADLVNVDVYVKIYNNYQEELAHSNALDFDDLLFVTYNLFIQRPDIADYYANRFEYIHVDEFQDTNEVQYAIIKRLALIHGNIFVVGDDDQSIYGWRGAKIENILEFDTFYSNAKVYKLERNYRSTKNILDLANCIIKNNTGRHEKQLWTDKNNGAKIETFVGSNGNNEASYCAIQIKNLLDRGYNYSDFAVFMRINAISYAFETEFTKYGIPYRVFGGFRFFERKEIKDIIAYLRIIVNPRDNESFIRAISTPKRGIGEKSIADLMEFSNGLGLPMMDGISLLGTSKISSGTVKKLEAFGTLIEDLRDFAKTHTPPQVIDYVLEKTSFLEQFSEDTEENLSKIYNINELKNTAEIFLKDNLDSTLADYLNSITLSTDSDDIKDDNAVTIATIHAVKGLEFKCVFIAGLEEKILPISRSLDIEEEMEEERRLMYVAVTRAKERLYLTRANSRNLYGHEEYTVASRFLKEGAPVLNPLGTEPKREYREKTSYQDGGYYRNVEEPFMDISNSGGYNSTYAKKEFLNNGKPKENGGNTQYSKGMKVRHAKFGDGIVINVENGESGAIAEVAFKGVGVKKLAVKYAPLEII